ncbi:hypothetical protein, partial [Phormidium sp. CCY1219]|uniref:hypothetical protein n=1 Tax=Phormidium sp. CCY1219 TaxID=2886104 RepID=UPI002D1EC597
KLVFTPGENFTGEINFGWNGFDGSSYASTDAKVNVSVAAINAAPEVSAFNKSGNQNGDISFLASDFTQAFADSEGDELEKIKITALPENGSLTL